MGRRNADDELVAGPAFQAKGIGGVKGIEPDLEIRDEACTLSFSKRRGAGVEKLHGGLGERGGRHLMFPCNQGCGRIFPVYQRFRFHADGVFCRVFFCKQEIAEDGICRTVPKEGGREGYFQGSTVFVEEIIIRTGEVRKAGLQLLLISRIFFCGKSVVRGDQKTEGFLAIESVFAFPLDIPPSADEQNGQKETGEEPRP